VPLKTNKRARSSSSSKPTKPAAKKRAPKLHPAERYAEDVASGKVVAGLFVRQCVARHLKDLKSGKKRGLYFDRVEAETVLSYFQFFKHSKGKWGGQPVVLEPWQIFIVWCLFGWMRSDGFRRFRRFYIEIARKNGKSTFIACIGIILLCLDGEQGAEVYSAATKKDQAKIVFNEAQRMVRKSPELRELVQVSKHSLSCEAFDAVFLPLSSDGDTLDGLNIHGGLVDELHAHKTREVWDVLDSGTGSRTQPMLGAITTAGFDQEGICYEVRSYCIDVLNPQLPDVEDDAFFPYIACIDDEDDPFDEKCWPKANPNLGVSVFLDDLRILARRARRNSAALNNFLCKRLNRWTQQAQRWISTTQWKKCRALKRDVAEFLNELLGRRCYGGLDLAEKSDLNAFSLVFPPQEKGEKWRYLWWFWLPQGAIDRAAEEGDHKYDKWVKDGLITVTEGSAVDHDLIANDIIAICKRFQCEQIGFDPFHAGHIVNRLTATGHTMVDTPQTTKWLSAACKSFEANINDKKIEHDGNPVQTWMIDNVTAYYDRTGEMKPEKPKDRRKKTDGVVAAVIATARAILAPEAPVPFTPFYV
jgi:phage terminase large subunit-like protein